MSVKNSKFTWRASKLAGKHHGQIFVKNYEPGNDGAFIGSKIVMDMTSITNEDMEGETRDMFLNHIKSGDFFEVEKYPESSLLINEVTDHEIKGSLTIKGHTNPVSVPFIKDGNSFKGTLQFDRTKFDIKYNSGNFFKDLGDNLIHDDVYVDFELEV